MARRAGVIIVDVPEFSKVVHFEAFFYPNGILAQGSLNKYESVFNYFAVICSV